MLTIDNVAYFYYLNNGSTQNPAFDIVDFCRDQTGFFLDLDIRECETMNMRNGLPQIKTNILAPKVPFRIYAGLRDPIMLLDPDKLRFLRTKNPSEYRFYPSATPPDAIAIWPPGPYHEHGGDIDMIIKGAQSWLYGMQAKREGKGWPLVESVEWDQ